VKKIIFGVVLLLSFAGCREPLDKHVDGLLETQLAVQLSDFIKLQQELQDVNVKVKDVVTKLQTSGNANPLQVRAIHLEADNLQGQMVSLNESVSTAKHELILSIVKLLQSDGYTTSVSNREDMETVKACIQRAIDERNSEFHAKNE
jgi:hypothetical protein